MSRFSTAPVSSRNRSASVDFPWSMCAMIEKLRMYFGSTIQFTPLRASAPRSSRKTERARPLWLTSAFCS
jgi:hypothetical protein